MTSHSPPKSREKRSAEERPAHWRLQDAKARFSEVVRRAGSDGPQHVTVRGREEVVIVSEEEYRRLNGNLTGRALVDACRASPHPDTGIEPKRLRLPVRRVSL
ncbi:MAG TPA: type II toxin-antitoxin system prevent-host-death family antitoxin [Rhizomicrobium sp.]|nr:type II toxin-antitoxin system prevent-host-death family antitoxin [Rhizomicrobium sp.]